MCAFVFFVDAGDIGPGWFFRIGSERAPLMYAGPFATADAAADVARFYAPEVVIRR